MAKQHLDKSEKNQIRNLLAVLVFAVFSGFLLLGFFIYNYGPTGRYPVKDALLAPDLIATLDYNDTNPKTGGMSRFLFDGIEFSYFDEEKNRQTKPINLEMYQQFYQVISNDKSLLEVPEEVIRSFNKGFAKLKINVRTESHAEWQNVSKEFQEVHLLTNGDYYRIQLHEQPQASSSQWVYYFHPEIYKSSLNIFQIQQ